jgi:hypothetical protein
VSAKIEALSKKVNAELRTNDTAERTADANAAIRANNPLTAHLEHAPEPS